MHRWLGRLDFLHVRQMAKFKYYFKMTKSANLVCDIFWAYCRSCSFLKNKLRCCISKGRGAVAAGISADFDR